MRYLFLLVSAFMVLAACTNKALDAADADGETLSEFEARSVLVNTQRWCDPTVQKDGTYSVEIFAADGSGQHALWNENTSNYQSSDPMSWGVNEDVLTRVLPRKYSPNILRQHVRLATINGHRVITLLDENGDRQKLTACNGS